MILPTHEDGIPTDLYWDAMEHGGLTYGDSPSETYCAICGGETTEVGDQFGGAVYCSETGEMLFDF